jgi:Flp pilus assembly secretin CpaC
MRRLLIAACLALIAAPALAQPAAQLSVPIDQSVRVGFSGRARDVVVGNPAIADVTLLDAGAAMILGKAYGVTSIAAFDAEGRTIFSRKVVVVAGDDNQLAYYRGAQLNNYTCAARCEKATGPQGAATPPAAQP